MTNSRIKLALGITLSFSLPAMAVAGCGGDNSVPNSAGGSTGTGGSAGSTSTGGVAGTATTGGATSGGTGGSTGGTTGGSAGAGGSGGQSVPFQCTASVLSVDAPNITDFSVTAVDGTQTHWGQELGDAGVSHDTLWGGIFRYGDDKNMNQNNVQFSVAGGNLAATGEVEGYSGVGLWFGPCVDARAFTGISFDVMGTDIGSPSQITVMLQTNSDSPISPVDMRGACPFTSDTTKYSECAQPAVTRMVTDTSTTVEVRWADLTGGKPSAGTDGSDLVGIQFQYPWSDTAALYNPTLTIDNIKFITTPAP